MKQCPHCKANIEDDARFCVFCMTSLSGKNPPASLPHAKKRRLPWLLTVCVTAVVLAVAAVWLWRGDPTTDSAAANPKTDATATTTAMTPVQTVTWQYRPAVQGDNFTTTPPEDDDIVIIGVQGTAADGVYEIPSSIDGKRVVAVMGLAFSEETVCEQVRVVVVPETVRTIHDHAFAACRNMTDVYLKGKSLYMYPQAFESVENRCDTLTLHGSYDCDNRNFRYYRDLAEAYDAVFEEWNGGDF